MIYNGKNYPIKERVLMGIEGSQENSDDPA
jgi:hypothetical protein